MSTDNEAQDLADQIEKFSLGAVVDILTAAIVLTEAVEAERKARVNAPEQRDESIRCVARATALVIRQVRAARAEALPNNEEPTK